MVRTIVAIADDALRDSIIRILRRSGIEVRISCHQSVSCLGAASSSVPPASPT